MGLSFVVELDHPLRGLMRRTSTSSHGPIETRSDAPDRETRERSGLPSEVRGEPHQDGHTRRTAGASPGAESSWVTPRQAAAYLGVGVDTIYEACAAADLKHVKLGYRTIRLRREWIDLWAEKHATPAR